ncbi:MAG: hypothetical protein HC908_01220 [Calothrix sp. SM1_7_51]|nr:hypothetical protein [Calothrix sp. SM1_7_51]
MTNNIRYFITSENLLIAANIRNGSACSLNQGVSLVKLSSFKIVNRVSSDVIISGNVENLLSIPNNDISQVSGKFETNAKIRTADWLIRNTEYYPEFIAQMDDCTTEGGLKRIQMNLNTP